MNSDQEQLEILWDRILSRKPKLIRLAFGTLDHPSQKTVLEHLHHMAQDDGWQPEQAASALAALKVLESNSSQDR